MFKPKEEMPKLQLCDIVVILQAKVRFLVPQTRDHISINITAQVQKRDFQAPSLLINYNSIVRLYDHSQIPRAPKPAVPDLSRSCFPSNCRGASRLPSSFESEYISQLYQRLDKTNLPNQGQWEVHVIQSQNVRDKFAELQKVETGQFYDIIVQVIRWHDGRGNITLWVSDYSENPGFFNHSIMSGELSEHQEGDPYGYNAKFTKSKKKQDPVWTGPYGRRSMQITCYDEQAVAIRENETKAGDWVKLRNIQVKYGSNGANLEGFLRHDESRAGIPKVNVYQLDPSEDPETMDPCLKNAIKRKRDYERSRKKEFKEVEEAATAGAKRKAAVAAGTTKSRRKKRKAAKNKTGDKTDGDQNDESHEASNDRSRQSSPEADATSIKLNPHGLFPIPDPAVPCY